MKVLVTGNLGYIGPAVVSELMEAGHHVVGVDTGWYLNEHPGRTTMPHKQYLGDIREPDDRWFEGVEAVVHLAGLSNDPMGELDADLTDDINFLGTISMLRPGLRHMFISSCSVYGASPDMISLESSETDPLTAYARAKRDVDGFLAEVGRYVGVTDWVSLRLGTVWGYSAGHRIDTVVNRMMYDAVHSGVITATGNAWRPIVHVDDVARAVAYFISKPQHQGIFNIVGENVCVMDIAERVARVHDSWYGSPVRIAASEAKGDLRDYRASDGRAYSVGFEATRQLSYDLYSLLLMTALLPDGREMTRLPIARKHLEASA